MEFTVGTDDLRRALRAVAPHADTAKDLPQLHRIRLDVGPDLLTVTATNRYTVGHALVSVWDHADGELGSVDLSPLDVREFLVLFKGKPGAAGEVPDDTVSIKVTEQHLTFTDVSGLFPGDKQLQLPRYPVEEDFPDAAKMIGGKIAAGKTAAERLITSPSLLALFLKAAAAYGEPLVFDTSGDGGALLITCGESLIGVLMPARPDPDELAKINGWHVSWFKRIADRIPAGPKRTRPRG